MTRVLCVGAGVGGLATALLLAEHGHDVTVLEQDAGPVPDQPEEAWAKWARPGVGQFRQIHLFNARGRNALRDELPSVLKQLHEAGARDAPAGPNGSNPDPDLMRLACRRTTYELVLRRAAEARRGIRILSGERVGGLLTRTRSEGRVQITGVRTVTGDRTANLVVDASGRRSRLRSWLEDAGARPPERLEGENGHVAYTRWYRLREPGDPPLLRADLGYALCVLAPADAGMFSLTFGCPADDPALRLLRRAKAFDAAVSAIPAIAPWAHPERVTAESPVRIMGDSPNHFLRLVAENGPVVTGIVALADAAVCTNPGYGRGISLALVHASCLAALLADGHDDPADVSRRFDEATRRELEPWYHAAVASDGLRRTVERRARAGEDPLSIGGPDDEPELRFARGLRHATERDPVVARAFTRTWHLLDPPATLWGSEEIRERVEAVWRDVRRSAPPPAGPPRTELLRLLAQSQ